MSRYSVHVMFLAIIANLAWAQGAGSTHGRSPTEVVDELWKIATQGDLLTTEGWQRARGFYKHPSPPPGNRTVNVVSNVWGLESQTSSGGETAQVIMGFADAGQIDATLKYTPPKDTGAVKTGRLYHLVFTPTHFQTYKSDGGELKVDKDVAGPKAWQIDDPPGAPFTTVNSAIRYVLDMRRKTTDENIRKNADKTIEMLLKLK